MSHVRMDTQGRNILAEIITPYISFPSANRMQIFFPVVRHFLFVF